MRQNNVEMRKSLGNMRKRLLAAYKGNRTVKSGAKDLESPWYPILWDQLYVWHLNIKVGQLILKHTD